MMSEEDTYAPPPDLGLLFATNAQDLQAVKVFVDRIPEQRAFDAAVRAHWAATWRPGYDSQDVVAPRRNVMVFYGVGGVGKTSLSEELERRHASEHSPTATDWPSWNRGFTRSVTARVDLASENGLDLERVLLSIRVGVAALGRPMHAFDIALGRYWEQVHPNESIADYLRSDSRMARVAEALKLPDQITEGLKDVAQALGGSSAMVSVASQLAVTLTGGIRRKLAKRHAVEGCFRLAPMLEAEPTQENLSFYPHLLSWDIAEQAKKSAHDFHVAVFLDTFEDVTYGEQRRFERLLNRLVWLMPNVLFIVSTRNRLDWGDKAAEGQLHQAGPVAWPALVVGASEEPSQHLVGYLSAWDSDKFLRTRLRRDGVAVIPETFRARIARDSGGYPLYLDLAVARYLQVMDSGAEVTPEDFSGGFPALVTRVLRDLEAEERRLIRILSLLDSFDQALAAVVAELPSEAVARRLTHRAFVDYDENAPFPYAIHRLLREQVRQSDTGPDAFTDADWARYATRAFDELGRRFRQSRAPGDRPLVISILNQALRLADEFSLPVGWTADAAYSFIEDSLWESSLRPLVRLPPATAAAALAQTLVAITDRQVEGREQTAVLLSRLLASDLLAGDAHDLATYYAAEALREIGRGVESERLLQTLVSRDSRIADLATKGMVHRLRRQGRFTDALELIRSRPESGMWIQMTGTLYWSQGMLPEAKAAYLASRDLFLARDRPGHAAEVAGCLAFVCGLSGVAAEDAGLVTAGLDTLRQSRNTWARLMARLGSAMLAADGQEATTVRLAAIREDGVAAGLTSIQAYARLGDCLNAALRGDDSGLRSARDELAAAGAGDFHWLVEIADFWLDPASAEPATSPGSDWLGGVAAARMRWRRIVADRRGAADRPA
jgi:hypothetical protein